jgi:hypothetical protein
MSQISCKELISIFEKVGGKLECIYDTRTCTLLPQNISAKITTENRIDIGSLLCGFAYSGEYNKYVTTLPESAERKNSGFAIDTIHDYQENHAGGFIIEMGKDKDGFIIPYTSR